MADASADFYTWKEFGDLVRTLLLVDKDRLGVQDTVDANGQSVPGYLSLTIRQAVIDLQEYIEALRTGHEDTYAFSDFTQEEQASLASLPPFARVQEAYLVQGQVVYPLNDYPWELRYELIKGLVDIIDNNGKIAINPAGAQFMVYPALPDDSWQLKLVWDGKKSDFADEDKVPFPEEAALAVAEYVKGRMARDVDDDLAKFASYFHPKDGTYTKARKLLYLAIKDRQSVQS